MQDEFDLIFLPYSNRIAIPIMDQIIYIYLFIFTLFLG